MISTKKFETKLVDLTVSITPAEPDGKLFTYEIWGENDDTEKAVPIYNLTRVQDKVVGAQSLICVLTREASMKQVKATRRSGVNFVKVTRRSGVSSVRFTKVKESLAVGSYAQPFHAMPSLLWSYSYAQKSPIGPAQWPHLILYIDSKSHLRGWMSRLFLNLFCSIFLFSTSK